MIFSKLLRAILAVGYWPRLMHHGRMLDADKLLYPALHLSGSIPMHTFPTPAGMYWPELAAPLMCDPCHSFADPAHPG